MTDPTEPGDPERPDATGPDQTAAARPPQRWIVPTDDDDDPELVPLPRPRPPAEPNPERLAAERTGEPAITASGSNPDPLAAEPGGSAIGPAQPSQAAPAEAQQAEPSGHADSGDRSAEDEDEDARPTEVMPAVGTDDSDPDEDRARVLAAVGGSAAMRSADNGAADSTAATAGESSSTVGAPRAASRTSGSVGRTALRGVGQLLITAGVVVLLFVVYELWITDIFSEHKQSAATEQLDQLWQPPATAAATSGKTTASSSSAATQVVTVTDPNKLVVDPRSRKRTYQTFDGQGFAKIYIPSFGADYVYTVIEGTNPDDLDVGPGHYKDTQYPGEAGNFAMAGHRVSKGSPFNQLGLLSSCDAVVIETKDDWFVYRVLPMQNETAGWKSAGRPKCAKVAPLAGSYKGIFGREITQPSDYAQVLPVPHVNSAKIPANAQRLITLTTCHPQFSDSERMIVHGVLVKSYQKSGNFLPPELKES